MRAAIGAAVTATEKNLFNKTTDTNRSNYYILADFSKSNVFHNNLSSPKYFSNRTTYTKVPLEKNRTRGLNERVKGKYKKLIHQSMPSLEPPNYPSKEPSLH